MRHPCGIGSPTETPPGPLGVRGCLLVFVLVFWCGFFGGVLPLGLCYICCIVLHVAALCCIVLHMATRLTLSLSEGLAARVRERASVEGRSLSNMLERLVVLGLGAVVTERGGTDPERGHMRAEVSQQASGASSSIQQTPPRSVTAVPERLPVSGGLVPPFDAVPSVARREFKPDFKVGTKL